MIRFQERSYATSWITKDIYNTVKRFVPRSKRMGLARAAVKSDSNVKTLAHKLSTNPGSVAKEITETIGKNPLSVAPGYTGTTAALTALKKGKLTTPDSVLKKTIIGKPIYAATEYTGRVVGRLAEPLVNSAYNMAKAM